MDALEISYRLKRLGLTQAGLARQLGVSTSVVGNVIHDRVTAFDIARHIAQLLGEDVSTLWPHRYCFKPRGSMAQRKNQRTQEERAQVGKPGALDTQGGTL